LNHPRNRAGSFGGPVVEDLALSAGNACANVAFASLLSHGFDKPVRACERLRREVKHCSLNWPAFLRASAGDPKPEWNSGWGERQRRTVAKATSKAKPVS